jgi:WD40 repeat protein
VLNCDRQLSVLRFSPDGKLLAGGGMDRTIRLWSVDGKKQQDWAGGQLRHTLEIGGDSDGFVDDLWMHPDARPFFVLASLANSHALAVHPNGRRLAVSASNTGTNGNGRRVGKGGEYAGNFSPVHLFDLPEG